MEAIRKKFIKDKDNKNVAGEMSIEEFNKIEQILEDYALGELIKESESSGKFTIEDAKSYYSTL